MSNPKMLVCNVSAHSMLRDGQKLLNVAFTDISFAAGYFDKTIGERRLTDIQLALNDVYEHYAAMTKAVERIRQIGEELIAEEIKEVAERAFELGCVAVDAEEHGVGCRFTVEQLEELSRDYGRDAYSVNNPYGRGES